MKIINSLTLRKVFALLLIHFDYPFTGKEEYASRTAGLSMGYVLAVIVPVFLMVVCFAFHWIQQHNLKIANEHS